MVKNTTFSTRSDLKNENSPSTSRGEETERLVRFEDEKKQIFSLSNLEFIAEKVNKIVKKKFIYLLIIFFFFVHRAN